MGRLIDQGAAGGSYELLAQFHQLLQTLIPAEPLPVEDSGELALLTTGDLAATYSALSAVGSAAASQAAPGLPDVRESLWDGAKQALRLAAYYAMKVRADRIGRKGLGPLLDGLHRQVPGVRVHLLGRDLGARLVAFALCGITSPGASPVASLYLVEGALSAWSFAEVTPFGGAGALSHCNDRVHGPLVAIFGENDRAMSRLYLQASIQTKMSVDPGIDAVNQWDAMGSHGFQGVSPASSSNLISSGQAHSLTPGSFYHVDRSGTSQPSLRSAHSPTQNPQVAWFAATAWGPPSQPGAAAPSRRESPSGPEVNPPQSAAIPPKPVLPDLLDLEQQRQTLAQELVDLRNAGKDPAREAELREALKENTDHRLRALLEQPKRRRTAPVFDSAPSFPEGSAVRATREGDRVECSVFAPAMVLPGSTFMIQAFAHISSQTRAAIRRAKEFDADAVRRAIKTLESNVPRGTKLSFNLTMPGFRVDDPVQSMLWSGATESVQFGVSVPKRCRPGNVIGTLTVSQDWIPIGHIKFTLTVTTSPERPNRPISAVGEAARRYEMAFISYASEDRTTVLERVQVLPTVGVRTFQDVLNLEPGERWERSLYRHIDESDIVLLFWSNAAKRSKWVRKEVRYALDRKHSDEFAPPEISPVIIEGPPVPRPWKELAYLHFNDPRIYIINHENSSGNDQP
jgi:hypothetical protein